MIGRERDGEIVAGAATRSTRWGGMGKLASPIWPWRQPWVAEPRPSENRVALPGNAAASAGTLRLLAAALPETFRVFLVCNSIL